MTIKEIAQKFCETNSLDISELGIIISEYCLKFGNRQVTPEQLNMIMQVNSIAPIRVVFLINELLPDNCYIVELYTPINNGVQYQFMRRFLHEG